MILQTLQDEKFTIWKRTIAGQVAKDLPPMVIDEILNLAKKNLGVDFNTCEKLGDCSYLIGYPRTKLTILATRNGAIFRT